MKIRAPMWVRIPIVAIALAGAFSYGVPGRTASGGIHTPSIAGRCAGFEVWGKPGPWAQEDC